MPVPFLQNSMSSGELDPLLHRRADVKVFYTGLEKGRNVLPLPQSGFRLRGATRHMSKVRHNLVPVALTAGMFTLRAGATGTAGNLIDSNDATTVVFALQAAAGLVLTLDMGVSRNLAALDLTRFSAPTGGLNWLIIETSADGVSYSEWTRRDLRPSVNTRRIATAPGLVRACRFIRITTAGGHGAITLSGLACWEHGTAKQPVQLFRHATEASHWLAVVTPGHVDLFENETFVTAAAVPYLAADIPGLSSAHDPGGILLFSINHQPVLLQPRGAAAEWDSAPFVFTAIPTRQFPDGVAAEAIMSATRGWPACGAFINERLVLGGLRSLPQTVVFSRQGTPSNLDTTPTLATDAFLLDLRGDEQGTPNIRRLRAGPRLEVYTQMGFFYASSDVIAKGTGFGFVLAERTPIAPATRVVDASNLAYFVEDGGAVIRQLSYEEQQLERYRTQEISVFSSHLIKGARDMSRRPARSAQGMTLLNIVSATGEWVIASTLPTQELLGYNPQDVGGLVLAVAALGAAYETVLAVDRGGDVHLEIMDDSRLLDMSLVLAGAPVITGLGHLEGRSDVWLRSNEGIFGPFTVTGGQITTGLATTGACEIGVPFGWEVWQLRLAGDAQRQVAWNRTVAVSVVKLDLEAASVFDMAVDDSPWRTIELPPMPATLDPDLAGRIYKGEWEEDGFSGLPDGKVKLRGTSLHPFHCKAILREATW
jgi:hypothetical protein